MKIVKYNNKPKISALAISLCQKEGMAEAKRSSISGKLNMIKNNMAKKVIANK